MKRNARTEGLRYPNGVSDSIPAWIYTQPVALETLRLADLVLSLTQRKLTQCNDIVQQEKDEQ